MRKDKRGSDELRPVKIVTDVMKYAEGSAIIEVGDTKVICTASMDDKVPQFLIGSGKGWITAEYGMLPRSTYNRSVRDASRGKISGRSHEIQRLIGRSLRTIVDLHGLGERTIWIDCDVIQADGGTRTASITGAFCSLYCAMEKMKSKGLIPTLLLRDYLAAVSVGTLTGMPMLDLDYDEDSRASVDMNVVMTGQGLFVEIQGTAEDAPFEETVFDEFLGLAKKGIAELISIQKKVLGPLF
ncbi:ribonuclease PH [bacterium]|nr:ribonuclease PH [bacterium]